MDVVSNGVRGVDREPASSAFEEVSQRLTLLNADGDLRCVGDQQVGVRDGRRVVVVVEAIGANAAGVVKGLSQTYPGEVEIMIADGTAADEICEKWSSHRLGLPSH